MAEVSSTELKPNLSFVDFFFLFVPLNIQGEEVRSSLFIPPPWPILTLSHYQVEYELVQGPKGFQAANLTGPGGKLRLSIEIMNQH